MKSFNISSMTLRCWKSKTKKNNNTIIRRTPGFSKTTKDFTKTWNREQGTGNEERETEEGEQGTGNGTLKTRHGKRGTGNKNGERERVMGKWKMRTKPKLNCSPISNFTSHSLFCQFPFFIFLFPVLIIAVPAMTGKTSPKKWIRAALNFFAFIPSRSIWQILANFSGVEF